MKTYTLSNTNIDSIKYYLPKKIKVVGSCAYGNYLIDLLDENSGLYKNDIDLVIMLIDGDELKITNDLQEIFSAVDNFLIKRKCTFLFSTVLLKSPYIDTFLNISSEFEFNTNNKIINFCKENNQIFLLDVHKIISKFGLKKCLDNKFWYIGMIKYTALFFKEIAEEIVNIVYAINTAEKKALILDLDNTIWGGVIGEDGNNIKISNEGIGKVYSEFQKNIKYLGEIGVLLIINSKNNYEDAISGLNHKNSILSKDDFILIKANWNNKVENMLEIAEELNLGLDSYVFIEDSPLEREMVKDALLEVVVPEPPKDLYLYNEWFISDVVGKYFAKTNLISDDFNKVDQYKKSIKRRELKSKIINVDLFIKSLDININVLIDELSHAERLSQLTQKTNQFNLTTYRYNVNKMIKFITSDSYHVYSLEYKDRFRNEGIVGAAVIKIVKKKAIIDVFLLSCRVLSRKIEFSFLNEIYRHLVSTNIDFDVVVGTYCPTKKNSIVENFYQEAGFLKTGRQVFTKEIE